nr:unnamed protein product [Spirometra erinaceieuropaei]
MERQLHEGMMTRVTDNDAISEAFAATNGMKQSFVLAPTLFSFMSSAILMDPCRDEHPGISIVCPNVSIHDLLFMEDCALNAATEVDMQRSMDLFAAGRANVRLAINKDKTVIIHLPSTDIEHNIPRIIVNGTQIKTVNKFVHLGSTISRSIKINDEVAHRISKADRALG